LKEKNPAFIIILSHDGRLNKFGFGGGEPFIEIQVKQDKKRSTTVNRNPKNTSSKPEKIPLYIGNDKLKGRVDIKLDRRRKVDHMGIKVPLTRSNLSGPSK
jgi:hypothetical protein